MDGVSVVFSPTALAEYMRSPSGPVMRAIFIRADVVVDGAKRRVGYSKPDPLGRPYPKKNHIRDVIVKRIGSVGSEPAVLIIAEDPIALMHHQGTPPHVIRPRRATVLRFYAPGGGRGGQLGPAGNVVYARKVNHPGTQPNRFLTDSLADLRGAF